MNYGEALGLGLLQGLTEFLPVSSSGHLVIAQYFLGIKQPGVTLEVMVHFGTLLSIVWVFRRDILQLLTGIFSDAGEKRFGVLLFWGLIPTGVMGVLFGSFFTSIFAQPHLVGLALLVTGFIILAISKVDVKSKGVKKMKVTDALIIGLFQGIAIIPGITRSGSTILGALWRGLDRETAVRYSFLLALPVIAGATLLEMKDFLGVTANLKIIYPYLVATLVAFISGIFAITLFIKLLNEGRFYYMAYYCWGLGFLTIAGYLLSVS
ncbi:MAG: undecaprenyl-diphosphate phosphatase [Firmicutes bacterium]|nr:undecaprenyl-diphosphate phosphatase [Bacillota bacterium]